MYIFKSDLENLSTLSIVVLSSSWRVRSRIQKLSFFVVSDPKQSIMLVSFPFLPQDHVLNPTFSCPIQLSVILGSFTLMFVSDCVDLRKRLERNLLKTNSVIWR